LATNCIWQASSYCWIFRTGPLISFSRNQYPSFLPFTTHSVRINMFRSLGTRSKKCSPNGMARIGSDHTSSRRDIRVFIGDTELSYQSQGNQSGTLDYGHIVTFSPQQVHRGQSTERTTCQQTNYKVSITSG
jgi:hypothetical protein